MFKYGQHFKEVEREFFWLGLPTYTKKKCISRVSIRGSINMKSQNMNFCVQTVDNAIHRINHYPLDIAIGFAINYPVDSDLSGG